MRSLFLLSGLALAKIEIKAMEHDVQEITGRNFDSVISKFRDSAVASIFFFTPSDSVATFDMYNEVAKDLKGMAKITAINCEEWPVFCKDQDATETPSIKLFPTNPMSAFNYKGKMEKGPVLKAVSKMIPNMASELKSEDADTFLVSELSKPKVLLFSDKAKIPTILKALSSETVFRRSIKFAFVKKEEEALVKRFKVKKFPTFVMVRGSKAEIKEQYKGELNFRDLQAWVNLFSESGMGDKMHKGDASAEEDSIEDAKPWLVQEVPELTIASQADICFKGEGLCAIYLTSKDISPDESSMLAGLKAKFTSQLEGRGATFKWMWMNLGVETGFAELFAAESLPGLVVFNPHKRLRFTKLEAEASSTAITGFIDKIQGGDARFTMVKGQKLPKWAVRSAGAKKGKGAKVEL